MNKAPVYILSQPVQTGKTSLLARWVKNRPGVQGILTPDAGGLRKLYDIGRNQWFNLQVGEEQPGLKIGRFTFDPAAFVQAQHIIRSAMNKSGTWLVIDEIGRLELDRGAGLEPAVSEVIRYFREQALPARLLLVIRDYLLNRAVEHYSLQDAVVLDRTFFRSRHELCGLVLCGGKSVRMGTDKSMITYHRMPQYAHMASLITPFCKEVFLSCREEQKKQFSEQYHAITDSATFEDAGPMTGLLSAFAELKNESVLVAGCDYPNLASQDMLALAESREPGFDAVCYRNPATGFLEPLLAVYENTCRDALFGFYRNGGRSLRQFLQTVSTKTIDGVPASLTSADTPRGNIL